MTTKTAALAALALLLTTAPTIARDGLTTMNDNQIRVHVSPTDMTTPRGRAHWLKMVEQAAYRLCTHYRELSLQGACVRQTVNETAALPDQGPLMLALSERAGRARPVRLASR
ncbi:MAG: UrcA family protein [Pseudolabrys sp.]|nr:UrcA family protein [Pseudolabrys sp.]